MIHSERTSSRFFRPPQTQKKGKFLAHKKHFFPKVLLVENSHLCPELFPQEAETEAKSRKEESDKAGLGGGPVGGSKALWGRLENVHPKY